MHFLGILSINYLEFRPYTAAAAISRNWGIGQIYAAAIINNDNDSYFYNRVVNEPSRSFTVSQCPGRAATREKV